MNGSQGTGSKKFENIRFSGRGCLCPQFCNHQNHPQNLKGDIKAFSIDSGQVLEEKSYPFDTMVQVIDGEAEVTIQEISSTLNKGEAIIIPAYSSNSFKANERFKMILTVLKSGARMQIDCLD